MYLKGESLGFDLVGLWQSSMYKRYKVLDGFAAYTITPETVGVVAEGS